MLVILTSVLWLLVFSWLVSVALTFYGIAREHRLLPTSAPTLPRETPFVSILVPARNEERRVLADCIRSILDQDYPKFEVIAVNDRSTDRTGQILATLAKANERLRVIEGEEPPAGWLGKPFAMHQAIAEARGEWLLATDADMIFDQRAVRTALTHVLADRADAITLIPHYEAGSFWERVMIPTWAWVFLIFTLVYRISNPKTQGAAGIGGFFLLRRSTLERIGGYAALKDEVMEDVRMAEMVKRSGARLFTEYAPALVSTRMYSNFKEMWECSTKNWFSGVKFSLPFAMLCVLSMYAMTVLPPLIALASLIGIVIGTEANLWFLFVPAALCWLLQILVMTLASVRCGVSPVFGLTAPLGPALLYAMLFDSSIRITTGIGVTWKGRRIYERSGVRPPRLRADTGVHVSNAEE